MLKGRMIMNVKKLTVMLLICAMLITIGCPFAATEDSKVFHTIEFMGMLMITGYIGEDT